MHELPRGFGKEGYNEAVKLYGLAANQGHTGSALILGKIYEYGRGVPQDF